MISVQSTDTSSLNYNNYMYMYFQTIRFDIRPTARDIVDATVFMVPT